jgi:transcriptional regulator with PAS, ATPase and Fis domain
LQALSPAHFSASQPATHRAAGGASSENKSSRVYRETISQDICFLAASPKMLEIRKQILQIAPVDVPVFIHGESGVGKEVIARTIHMRSTRCNRPFIKVNCAALPGDLLESELFGFKQGAFTGADHSKPGKFELANKGTIFLDEIAEMSPHLQATLLHVLQDHQYSKLGDRAMMDVDVRVLAATNVEIQEAMKTGRLREDIYFRLSVLSINVPPLRERTSEIPLLFQHFLQKYSKEFNKETLLLSQRLLDAAMCYPWPGNLRELENFVKRYVILEDEEICLSQLQAMTSPRQHISARSEVASAEKQGLKAFVRSVKDEIEAEAITRTLQKTHWRRNAAAKILGISYKALLYKIRQYGLDTNRSGHELSAGAEASFHEIEDEAMSACG